MMPKNQPENPLDLPESLTLDSKVQFLELADHLNALIAQGKLVQTSGNFRIADFRDDLPFENALITMKFESIPDRVVYKLSCDSDRGQGGVFRRVSEKDDIIPERVIIQSETQFLELAKRLKGLISRRRLLQTSGKYRIADFREGAPFPNDLITMKFEELPEGGTYVLQCDTENGLKGVFEKAT